MRHGDVALNAESKAITTYIDKAFPGPKLIPDDAHGAALVEQWVSLVNTAIDPCLIRSYVVTYLRLEMTSGAPDRAAIDAAPSGVTEHIDVLDSAVAGTGHLAGDSFTLADIFLLPILHFVQLCPEGGEMVRLAKDLSAYFARHSQRPCYKASFPPPLPGAL